MHGQDCFDGAKQGSAEYKELVSVARKLSRCHASHRRPRMFTLTKRFY